jgi:membrane fusion protein (multidrug efflux system)
VEAAAFNARLAVLTAPDDGVLAHRAVEPGEVVAPGRPVLRLAGRGQGAVVRVGLPDRDAVLVSVGDRAEVTVDAQPGRVHAAHVSQVAGVASPATGTFDVEVRLDTAPRTLLSGLSAKVAIAHREQPQATVPLSALVAGSGSGSGPGAESGGRTAVFTVQDGRALRVPVEVGFLYGDRAAIASGLERIESVVVAGTEALTDQAVVRAAVEQDVARAASGR